MTDHTCNGTDDLGACDLPPKWVTLDSRDRAVYSCGVHLSRIIKRRSSDLTTIRVRKITYKGKDQ